MTHNKNNTAIVANNKRKSKDSDPDVTGTANIEGIEYWVNGWENPSKFGDGTFYKLSFRKKEDSPTEVRSAPVQNDTVGADPAFIASAKQSEIEWKQQNTTMDDLNDDMPF